MNIFMSKVDDLYQNIDNYTLNEINEKLSMLDNDFDTLSTSIVLNESEKEYVLYQYLKGMSNRNKPLIKSVLHRIINSYSSYNNSVGKIELLTSGYDVLITDINSELLTNEISNRIGYNYLSECKEEIRNNGIFYGISERLLLCYAVTIKNITKNVIFIFDTGSPITFLSQEACDSFGFDLSDSFKCKINTFQILARISPPKSHFNNISIIGSDYCRVTDAVVNINYKDNIFQINY